MDPDSVRRRRVLYSGAAILAGSLAGCSGNGGSSTESPASGGSNVTGTGTRGGSDAATDSGDGTLLESSAYPGEVVKDEVAAIRPVSHRALANGNVEFTFENLDSKEIQVWDQLYEYYVDVRWFDGSDTRLDDPDLFRVPRDSRLNPSTATATPTATTQATATTPTTSGATSAPGTTTQSGDSAGDRWAKNPAVVVPGESTFTVTAKAPEVSTSEFDRYEIAILRDPAL